MILFTVEVAIDFRLLVFIVFVCCGGCDRLARVDEIRLRLCACSAPSLDLCRI